MGDRYRAVYFGFALEAFRRELGKVRTGRANLSILDGVRVEYYGTPTPLNQVASLSIPEPSLMKRRKWKNSPAKTARWKCASQKTTPKPRSSPPRVKAAFQSRAAFSGMGTGV